ncbi:MAG TPA: alanine--tRNA ligase, partial [Candidatus Megaira endosymbiont of Hartmannula sinica]|nr:alanine--tRNA ligase [Candidatus Megaera endosymbiont of Hartmannula sinica]
MLKTTSQIRSSFLGYFNQNEHEIVESSSLVPSNDPTLMFTNSGMVQFKDVFIGNQIRVNSKATSSQRCIRAGGKHNDLENVGYTARHHTFFEMLGNFSFGDYFKEEAIYYAWEFLTKELLLDKEKLYVTVFHTDSEARNLWKKISGLSNSKIINIKTNDNFWSMGDTGPCGPCSEIFYDHGENIFGSLPGTKDEDGDRFIEIWNLVFMQQEMRAGGIMTPLAKKSIDTGMGLERISAVMQGKVNNYETDIFLNIINILTDLIKVKAEGDSLFSYRVIADHMRAIIFLITSGVMPSNEGRGYVLRRIMRRAMRHTYMLGSKDKAILYKAVDSIISIYGDSFKDLTRASDLIKNLLMQEEASFNKTLARGVKILNEEINNIKKSNNSINIKDTINNKSFSGEVAFKLYDTYGFPIDLTQDMLKSQDGLEVDMDVFQNEMDKQKQRARDNWKTSSGFLDGKLDDVWFEITKNYKFTEFLGYNSHKTSAQVNFIIKNNKLVNNISYKPDGDNKDNEFILITNQTVFYGESGGQSGDIGLISGKEGNVSLAIDVIDTKKIFNKIIFHICRIKSGSLAVEENIDLSIDNIYRHGLKIHHSATHILHSVLRNYLGKHITQKGSLVSHNKLRFDISHPKQITRDQIYYIEKEVNSIINTNAEIVTELKQQEEAKEKGAMALFGEKYEDEVRVVSMQSKVGDINDQIESYSFELCGGTHIDNTGEIGLFKIISEQSVASGIRRIEAICGMDAITYILEQQRIIDVITDSLKIKQNNLIAKFQEIIEINKNLTKKIEKLEIQEFIFDKNKINQISQDVKINDSNIKLILQKINITNIDIKILKQALENNVKNFDNLVILYQVSLAGQSKVLIAVSKNLNEIITAKNIIKTLSTEFSLNSPPHYLNHHS